MSLIYALCGHFLPLSFPLYNVKWEEITAPPEVRILIGTKVLYGRALGLDLFTVSSAPTFAKEVSGS